jgi:predicted dehydrogenase
MAQSVADARAIVRAAQRAGRVLTVYQPHRAAAYYQHVRRLVRSGKLGAVHHVRRGSFNWVRRNDWQALRKYGGGMLNNYGAHYIDQLFDLTGADVARLFCRLGRVASLGDAEDTVKIAYRTRDGVLGEIDINQATPRAPYELEVYGTRGTLWMEGGTLHLRYFRPRDLAPRKLDTALASANREYPHEQVKFREESITVNPRYKVDVYADFARAVRTGADPFVKPSETLAVMTMIARCRREAGSIVE